MAMRPLLAVLSLAFLGCGTVVYRHTVEVVISDPSHRLGQSPVDVSVFDQRMGSTADWARRWMGPTSDAAPYRVPFRTTSAATIFDPPRPDKVELALAVPRLEERGFFTLIVSPRPHASGQVKAAFVPYGDYFPAENALTLPVQYTATPEPKGWHLVIRLLVPSAP